MRLNHNMMKRFNLCFQIQLALLHTGVQMSLLIFFVILITIAGMLYEVRRCKLNR